MNISHLAAEGIHCDSSGEITATDVTLSSCFQFPGTSVWNSGFVARRDYELFSLRRPGELFGAFCDAFPVLPIGDELDRAYFGGVLFPYYGHFLIESLARLPNIPDDGSRIVFMTLENTVTPWQRTFFSDIGIDHRLVVTSQDAFARIRELVRVDQTTVVRSDISSRYVGYMRRLFPASGEPNGLLYVSRTRCRNAPVGGEAAFQNELRRRGFEVVHPEDLSIREQAQKYDRASTIVAIEGSALHTLLLTSAPKTVMVLRRRGELDINFRLQFSMQPHLQVRELGCMKRYANDFYDDSELDVDAALSAIDRAMQL